MQFLTEQHFLLWMDCGRWNKCLSKYNNLHVDSQQHYQRVKSSLTRINMESLNKADIEFILPKEEETTACNLTRICQTVTSLQSLNKNNKQRMDGRERGSVCGSDLNQQKDSKNRANRAGIWCCFLLFQKEVQLWYKAFITVGSWKRTVSSGPGDISLNTFYDNQKSSFWYWCITYHVCREVENQPHQHTLSSSWL